MLKVSHELSNALNEPLNAQTSYQKFQMYWITNHYIMHCQMVNDKMSKSLLMPSLRTTTTTQSQPTPMPPPTLPTPLGCRMQQNAQIFDALVTFDSFDELDWHTCLNHQQQTTQSWLSTNPTATTTNNNITNNPNNHLQKKTSSWSNLFGATMGLAMFWWVYSGNFIFIFTALFTLMMALGQLDYYQMVINVETSRRISLFTNK